jgi:hypothetical protein
VVYGCANGFFGPVSAAVLPDVVALDRITAANALIGGISSSVTIVAPALAGLIVAVFGPGAGFALESSLLAATSACLGAARIPEVRTAAGPLVAASEATAADAAMTGAEPGLLAQLRTGWQVFGRLRWLWLLTLQWTVFSMLVLAPVAVLGPTIALRYLGGAAAWGVISSCLAAGLVAGQFVVGRLRLSRPPQISACLCPVGIAEALALGLSAPVPVICAAAAISGLAMGAQSVIFQATMQTTVPAPVLARVAAFDLLGSELGQPAGYALAGPLGAAAGVRVFLTASTAVALAAVLPFAAAPSLRAGNEDLARIGVESIEPTWAG